MKTSSASLGLQAKAELERRRRSKHKRAEPQLDVIPWIEQNFYIPELNGPIVIAPYQKRVLTEALSKDANGLYKYSTVVWSDIKKSAKSCLAAAVGLWFAYHSEYGQVLSVANDLKQADSRVHYYARRAIELNPRMKAEVAIRNYKMTFPSHSTFEAIPIDPSGEAGGGADLVILSELWGSHSIAQQRMWSEVTLSPLKFGKSLRWVETYAGYTGESTTLENLYTTGVKQGRKLWDDLPVWANGRLLVMWNETPRLPWQSKEYYSQEAATLTPTEFQRLHRNQWVSSLAQFVPAEWWNACKRPVPQTDESTPLIFALDAAVSGDCFGVLGVSRHPTNERDIVVRYAQKWTPPQGGKIDFAPIKDEVRRLAERHNVLEWAYDPYQLHSFCSELQSEGVGWFREFSQGEQRLVADKQLFDLIRDRHIWHSGEPDLTEHIQNANAKSEGEKLRIVKRSAEAKIDLAICLSMSAAEALRLNL